MDVNGPAGKDAPKEVGPEHDGLLVDAVARALFALSWGRARELVRRGKISVDGRVVSKPTLRVRAGSTIALNLAARDPKAARSALEPDAIVHLDAHIVVVEKPSGISTVPYDPDGMGASIAMRTKPGQEATLDQRVRVALAKRERARGRSGPPPEIGIVHRLDKETTGLLVFTRTWLAKKALTQDFRAHRVHRRYLALVHGVPKGGTIESHFIEDRGDGLRGSVEHRRGRKHAVGSERTQRAITHIEVLERFGVASLIACQLETGRTHQIRIHLAEEGHPVLGERVYTRGWGGTAIPSPRVMLHAAELGFVHPASRPEVEEDAEAGSEPEGEQMRWTSEMPADMREMLEFLRKP